MALSASQRKFFSSLATTKGRRTEGCFVAEGSKCVHDLSVGFNINFLAATNEWISKHSDIVSRASIVETASRADLERITNLSNAPDVVAAFALTDDPRPIYADETTLIVALDRVQDPGNLGTIIRVCDWMGVPMIVASPDTVDAFNPKVVQATMGSLARVRILYTDLVTYLNSQPCPTVHKYGTVLDDTAENIYDAKLSHGGILVMGNEGSGISDEIKQALSHKLYIPPYPIGAKTAESLNVAVATSIALAEFRRRANVHNHEVGINN